MKICLIADALSIHTLRWANYFVEQDEDVHLITYEYGNLDFVGTKVHIIKPIFNNLYLDFIPRHIRMYFLLRKIKPDIVHAHFISKFGFHAAFLGYRPLIMSAWGGDILVVPYWSKLLWYFTGVSLRKSDLVYGVSRDICNKIITNFKVPKYKVKLVPFGVDSNLFSPNTTTTNNNNNNNTIIVFSNRTFLEVYNVETLLRAIPYVINENQNIKFIIKGVGPLDAYLRTLASELNIGEYVTFIGWIEYKEMVDLLHKCDIYVSTALSDGSPVSVLEAMACEKACIVTNVGGVSEWIEDNVNGYLFTPKNELELSDKILKLASNAKERMRLGKNACNTIKDKGDWNKIMNGVKLQYNQLVREK